MAGDDWFRVGADGFGRPDVRVAFLTDDGETVLLRYQGLVQLTGAFKQAAKNDGATRFEDQCLAEPRASSSPRAGWRGRKRSSTVSTALPDCELVQ